jgi:hypothetical protein
VKKHTVKQHKPIKMRACVLCGRREEKNSRAHERHIAHPDGIGPVCRDWKNCSGLNREPETAQQVRERLGWPPHEGEWP